MANQDFILAPPTVRVEIALEPVFNAINSLALIDMEEERSGLSEWIFQTARALSPDQRQMLHVVVNILYKAVVPQRSYPSFSAYTAALAAEDPQAMRDRAIDWIYKVEQRPGYPIAPDRAELLADAGTFTHFIESYYTCKMDEKGESWDHKLNQAAYERAHSLLQNPVVMRDTVAAFLQQIWDEHLSAEWERRLPMLRESMEAFQQLDYSGMTLYEAARIVTGRDLSAVWQDWKSRHVVFVPSPHIGPYVTDFDAGDDTINWVVFGARLPEGARVKSPALSRSELMVRLSALADDTRLQILELLTQHDELCAQDVIDMLKLSQSAASRHLRQLTATGYLVERRREIAKCYTLNPKRVDDTLQALKGFLRVK